MFVRKFALPTLLVLAAVGIPSYLHARKAGLDATLVSAADANNVTLVNSLLDAGADPNARPHARSATTLARLLDTLLGRNRPFGDPVIVSAAVNERWPIVRSLASHHANLTFPSPYQLWPRTVAGMVVLNSQSPETLKVLLDHGADPNTVEATPRLFRPVGRQGGATISQHPETLLADRFSLLHFAAMFDDGRMTLLLLSRGARPNTADAFGCTPLMFAAAYRNEPVVRQLLAHGADVLAHDSTRENALHYAVGTRFLGMIGAGYADYGRETCAVSRLLLAHGADATAKNAAGLTPRKLDASDWRLPGVSSLLRRAEAEWRGQHLVARHSTTRRLSQIRR